MSGKGCQLLVSPCSVSPSLSVVRGAQAQSIRIPTSSPQHDNINTCSGMEAVKRGAMHPFAPGIQGRSHVVLPTLSLRRQVLTGGKLLNTQTESPQNQMPATMTAAAANQTGRCSSNGSFKGKNKGGKYQINAMCVSKM